SQRKVTREGNEFKVYVHEPANDGRANKAVCKLLAEYFKVAKSKVNIIKGQTSRNKVIEITKD
ncbi:MAG: hypothetical protein DRH24_16160, partial [Deltaproteobacteria bacterium]